MADNDVPENPPTSGVPPEEESDDELYFRAPKVEYRHTMADLEAELNRIMTRSCKIDACIDVFISRVLPLMKEAEDTRRRRNAYFSSYYFNEGLKKLAEDTIEPLKRELRENLNRLVPGCVPDENKDVLSGLKHRLEKRREVMVRTGGYGEGAIPRSLLDTLVEKQYRERVGHAAQVSSNEESALTESYRQLRNLIEDERSMASFACGGSIPITVHTHIGENRSLVACPPVSVFWSKRDDAAAQKLVLPVDGTDHQTDLDALRRLVTECDPASFGRGEQDVIDPEYRKAGKLDSNQFATSFHPADYGILDNVGQVLLPSIDSETDNELQFRRIKAEMYKMNVYSGPSGLFRKHVDTPRAANQIGSLVVCLPSKFTGGSLHVQHHGHKVTFDWSDKSDTRIQWAAFYSDCEHEIETITQGDRITLTYNLYVTEPIGQLLPSPTAPMDPKTLPLHGWMKDLLAQEDFMKDGGVLGFFCSHAYAHSSELAQNYLPRGLKGADLVLYSVFRSLGAEVSVVPIIDNNGRYGDGNPALGLSGKLPKRSHYYLGDDDWHGSTGLWEYLQNGEKQLVPSVMEIMPSSGECEDVDQRWKFLMMVRQVKGMTELLQSPEERGIAASEGNYYRRQGVHVGASCHPYETHDRGEGEDRDELMKELWPAYHLPGITWITEPKHEEMAFSQIAYGNEASIGTRYSCAAILAVIPPSEERASILRQA
ncbi:hypothetical protein BJY01DRAFT_260876 [Aspergillus pseudoustus]|uniref:Fe2OG dioxygenase domain-containing protein n=1 Tax=Aspergillus pseudoustus TaxID=1810923 RepID=A0ABR4IS63_9EURO